MLYVLCLLKVFGVVFCLQNNFATFALRPWHVGENNFIIEIINYNTVAL